MTIKKVKRKVPEENEVYIKDVEGIEITGYRGGRIHCLIPLKIVQNRPKLYNRIMNERKYK